MPPDLSKLKDVHIPKGLEEGASFFPPAIGWWLLLAIIILTPAVIWFIKFYRLRSAKLYALKQMEILKGEDGQNAAKFAEETSKLLRRIAILKYGKDKVAALSGQKWVDFLSATGGWQLSPRLSSLFAFAPYAKGQSFDAGSLAELESAAIGWIKKNT